MSECDHDHSHGSGLHGGVLGKALDDAERRCDAAGQRLTAPRRRVLELLLSNGAPVKAYDLMAAFGGADGDAAKPPTVYRALDFLQEHGFVHKIESLNAYVGCAEPTDRHGGQFLICGRCKAVAELDDPAIYETVRRRAEASGFTVQGQVIEVMGLCPRCAVTPHAPLAHNHEH